MYFHTSHIWYVKVIKRLIMIKDAFLRDQIKLWVLVLYNWFCVCVCLCHGPAYTYIKYMHIYANLRTIIRYRSLKSNLLKLTMEKHFLTGTSWLNLQGFWEKYPILIVSRLSYSDSWRVSVFSTRLTLSPSPEQEASYKKTVSHN